MLKKLNVILAIAALIILSGCEKGQDATTKPAKFKYHNLPPDVQSNLKDEVDSRGLDLTDDLADSLSQQSQDTDQSDTNTQDAPEGSANASILSEAVSALGESSAAGPDGGNLACAWMVNKILERSVGFKVDGDSTARMDTEFQALVSSGKAEKIDVSDSRPGDIILSPTGAKVGHVGIIGESNKVYSNSSSAAEWKQNFTIDRWTSYYQGSRDLPVNIYRIVS